MLGIVGSASGAASAVTYIGLRGNYNLDWDAICDSYDTFCFHIGFSVISSLLASLVLIILISFSFSSVINRLASSYGQLRNEWLWFLFKTIYLMCEFIYKCKDICGLGSLSYPLYLSLVSEKNNAQLQHHIWKSQWELRTHILARLFMLTIMASNLCLDWTSFSVYSWA